MKRWDIRKTEGLIYSGGWVAGSDGTAQVISPGNGTTVGTIGLAGEDDVERAGVLAQAAQKSWAKTSYRVRQSVMEKAAEALLEIRDEVEDILIRESGSLPGKALHEVDKAIDELKAAAGLVTAPQGEILPVEQPSTLGFARRIPVGVVGVIAPWNAPLMLAMRAVAPALALGNAVIVKPDPKTSFSGGAVIAEIFERAGLPENLLHILPGGPEAGEALVRSPHTEMITFTGSSAAGKRVGGVAGGMLKRVVLELGGNNAIVVMHDADVDGAARSGAMGTFRHQGQICMATGRHLVHEAIADAYVERLRELVAEMIVGDPLDPQSTLGPLISETQVQRVQDIVDTSVSDGARLITGGVHEGTFYQPTILDNVSNDNAAFTNEIFGPVAPITRFSSEEEALSLVNQSAYGLTASIHSQDVARALGFAGELNTGMIAINGQTIYDAAHIPMGGIGASGNGGRHGGHWNLDEFTYWQWVTVPVTGTLGGAA